MKWEKEEQGRVSLLIFLRWPSESSSSALAFYQQNRIHQRKKKGTDLLQIAARTEAHCCNNSDACWLLEVTGLTDIPASHSQTPCSPTLTWIILFPTNTGGTFFKNSISKFIFCQNSAMIKKNLYTDSLLHSNNFIHQFNLIHCVSPALKLSSSWGHFK